MGRLNVSLHYHPRLGRVSWIGEVAGPHEYADEVEGAEVVLGGLVVAGGDAPPVLDSVERPLDDACVAVSVGVEGVGAASAAGAASTVGFLVVAFA